jgi:hypothetical protein
MRRFALASLAIPPHAPRRPVTRTNPLDSSLIVRRPIPSGGTVDQIRRDTSCAIRQLKVGSNHEVSSNRA